MQREIRGYTYQARPGLMKSLTDAVHSAGGIVLFEENLSEHTIGLDIETPVHRVVDLCGELIASGMEMTKSGQASFAELCTYSHHACRQPNYDTVCLRIEVTLLKGVGLHTLLMGGGPLA